jgi:hypothetical protein
MGIYLPKLQQEQEDKHPLYPPELYPLLLTSLLDHLSFLFLEPMIHYMKIDSSLESILEGSSVYWLMNKKFSYF